jgi:hypothetical protein
VRCGHTSFRVRLVEQNDRSCSQDPNNCEQTGHPTNSLHESLMGCRLVHLAPHPWSIRHTSCLYHPQAIFTCFILHNFAHLSRILRERARHFERKFTPFQTKLSVRPTTGGAHWHCGGRLVAPLRPLGAVLSRVSVVNLALPAAFWRGPEARFAHLEHLEIWSTL